MTFALSHRSLAQFWHNARCIEGAVNTENELLHEDAARSGYRVQSQARSLPLQAASILAAQPRIAPSADMKLSHKRSELQAFARAHNLNMPLDLMVFSKQQRWTNSPSFHCHLTSAFVDIPCLFTHENALIGTPELSALQLSNSLDAIDTARYLYELCSRYVLNPSAKRGFSTCASLSSVEAICSLRETVANQRGLRKLDDALRITPSGYAASPRETALSMLLGLHPKLGGYGLVPIELNKRVELGRKSRSVYGKASCVCDLFFGTLDVEYDSTMEHEDIRSGVNDSLRSTALAFEGIEVIHVYAENLKSLERIDSLAMTIAQKLGRRLDLDQSDEGRRQRALLQQRLLRTHQPIL